MTTNSRLVPGIGREPFPAYRGDASYIFVSYAHADADLVFSEILRFQDMGYNIWYDEGIAAGNEWLKDILDHLMGCDLFVVFITNRSVNSNNVRKEINFAIKKEKKILPIYLEEFDEIDMDLDLEYELDMIQAILKTTMDDEEYVFKVTEAFAQFGFELKSQTIKRPDPPYMGDEPYIFINYALGDADLVFNEIKRLQDEGLNVFWHDNTFSSQEISNAIINSSLVISFMSPNLVRLRGARDEIDLALIDNKPLILIYLNKTDLPAALKLLLEDKTSILQYALVESEYVSQLNDSLNEYGFGISEIDDENFKAPMPPYKGDEKYIFVSYAHADAGIVFDEIKRFQNCGFNVFYDEGPYPESEWKEGLADGLEGCSLFVVFITGNSIMSPNVKSEIHFSLNQDIPIIPIYLEETELTGSLQLILAKSYSIMKFVMDDEEYISKCLEAFERYGLK